MTSWLANHTFTCPLCQAQFVVEFSELPGRKWHGFIAGDGHYLPWPLPMPASDTTVSTEQAAKQDTTHEA